MRRGGGYAAEYAHDDCNGGADKPKICTLMRVEKVQLYIHRTSKSVLSMGTHCMNGSCRIEMPQMICTKEERT